MTKTSKALLTGAALLALSGCGIFKGGKAKTPVLGERIPILVSESGAEADTSIASVPITLPAPAPNDSWTQPGGNAAKSMGQLALGAQPQRLWTAQINGGSNRERLGASPVVADGNLYVVDATGTVHALDAATGGERWTAAIAEGDKNREARFGGGVSYDSGKLYASDGLGNVVQLNAADGKLGWRAHPGAPLRGAPTVANGQVYVISQDNQLYALSQTDGTVAWTQSASLETQGVFGVAAPGAASGTIVAGFSSGELNAYRYENGRTLWQDALSRTAMSTSVSSLADIDADPVIDSGRAFAVGYGGRMVSIDLGTGQRVWEQNFASISTPWLAGNWLFLVTDDAKLACIDKGSGKVRWIAALPEYRKAKKKIGLITWEGPILAGGRLVLLNSEGQIVYASPENGAVQATIETKVPFELPPVIANSTLYTLDDRGRINAYR